MANPIFHHIREAVMVILQDLPDTPNTERVWREIDKLEERLVPKWVNMEDELPPLDQPYLAYMPDAKTSRGKLSMAIDRVPGNGGRMTIVGGAFSFDMPKITKWMNIDFIPKPTQEDT